jgi:hypothetical protein
MALGIVAQVSIGQSRRRTYYTGVETYVHVPLFWFIYVEEMARSSSPFRSFRVRQTGMGCLLIRSYNWIVKDEHLSQMTNKCNRNSKKLANGVR